MNTPTLAVPCDDHANIDADLAGVSTAIDMIRAGLRSIATTRHTLDETQTLIAVLAGASDDTTDILGLLTATVARLADPDTNPTLHTLPATDQDNLRRLAEAVRYDIAQYAPRDLVREMPACIEGI